MTRPAPEGLDSQPGQERPDPREFFRVLWRRRWILVLCVTLIPAAVYLYSGRLDETYEASVVMQIQPNAVEGGLTAGSTFVAPASSGTVNATIAALIETSALADQASRLLKEPRGSLRGAIDATDDDETGLITLTTSAGSAERAAIVANTFANAVRVTRERQGLRRVDAAIASVQEELKNLPARDVAQREQLTQTLQALRALRAAQGQNANVVEPATTLASPVSPNPERNAILALVVALLIAAGAVALAERLDRRLHDPRELERLTGTPLLAHVPASAFPGSAPDPQLPIVFQTLRDSLTYFNLDRPLTSLLVMSPVKGDGKTSVAMNLAAAYARAGKRVVLVDADLRSPQVARRTGGESKPGLSEVLTGGSDIENSLQEIEPFGDGLRILASGSIPPNPSEMLGSARMTTVLAELGELSDLVVIDTTPVLVVSDAFPLLDQVAGVVGVAQLDRTYRDAIKRSIEVTHKAGGRVLGMVATGGRPAGSYGYGYAYGDGYVPSAAGPEPQLARATAHSNGHDTREPKPGAGRRVRQVFRSG